MKKLASRGAFAISLGFLISCAAAGSDVSSSGKGGKSGAAGSAGSAGASGSSAGGSAGSAGSVANDPALAPSLSVSDVAVFQAVRVPIVQAGQPVGQLNAPILAARDTMFRIYVAPLDGWSPRDVTAELLIATPDGAVTSFTATRNIVAASSDQDASSVFDILVPAVNFPFGTTWSVRLISNDGVPTPAGTPSAARFPADGSSSGIDARVDNGGLNLVLVPIRYNYDGSGRLPDTSEAQLNRYRELITSVYPVSNVDLVIHDVFNWNKGPDSSGDFDFGALNDALWDLRASDNAPQYAYYYGLVNPANSVASYCSNWCTTGQSFVVDNGSNGDDRVGSGIGFTGDDSAWTLVHEVGHEHGREHAPCDVSPSDPGYPYSGGDIGVWGFDPRNQSFMSPSSVTDFMGYCPNTWVSDYTFTAMFRRVVEVNGLTPFAHVQRTFAAHTSVRVYPDGTSKWGSNVRVSSNNNGPRVSLTVLGANEDILSTVEAHLRRESHGGAKVLMIPQLPTGAKSIVGELPGGQPVRLFVP
ncbi:MAG: M66 family metalloprotease [Polyangiaceae bacterium]